MKKFDYFLLILLIINVSIFALVMAIERSAYDLDYYMDSYEKNGVYEVTHKSYEELENLSKKIIGVLKGNSDVSELSPYFSSKEISHMKDVQNLFIFAKVLKLIAAVSGLIIIFSYLRKDKSRIMGKWLGVGLSFNYVLLIILAVLVKTNFNKYFIIFHKLFFNNDLWLLDPNTDLLIQIMPETFFTGIVTKILLRFVFYILFGQLVGYIFYKKGKYNIPHYVNPKKY
ncbi:MAG TPA: TIGR01906 family membrane protein [Soehngenia sp.]|nr:TIGR01906 family membrane protein [Soehngenia sp.]